MRSHHVALREFLLSCLVMLAIALIAFAWASSAWLEHYQ
jgi:hypothetical protein